MGQSEVLSAPAGAPVFSASLAEAKARARQFYREVRASRRVASRLPFASRRPRPPRVVRVNPRDHRARPISRPSVPSDLKNALRPPSSVTLRARSCAARSRG
jgi:hypothetical protein